MKAILVSDDQNNSLAWREVAAPTPGPEEVLIRVSACAVNRADLLQRRGLYPPPEGASSILGLEAAGTIESTGAQVEGWQPGDRVCALLPGGGYAEYVTAPAAMLLRVPESLALMEAAAIPEVFYTAYLNLFIEGELLPGERVLVHAGASGVGTAAIQLCTLFGSPVWATTSRGKLEALRRMGVESALDRHAVSFREEILKETDQQGVSVVLDPVGADYLDDNLRALRVGGRLVCIGLLSGHRATLNLARLMRKRLKIIGSVLRSRSPAEKVEITRAFRADVWPAFSDGRLTPVVHEVLDITDAEKGHEMLRRNETVGKVVLRVPQRPATTRK